MEVNLGAPERVLRGTIGVVLLAVGLLVGRRSWWGIALDAAGALMLVNATTGFCHVYKTFGWCSRR